MSTTVIYGPPGTGKTTQLLNLMEQELAAGIEPQRIAYVSFTKAAVAVAIARAKDKFNCTRNDLRWFRTLHSLAFAAVGASREQMMPDYAVFGEDCGFLLPRRAVDPTEPFFNRTQTDELLVHVHGLCAATGLPVDRVAKAYGIEVPLHRYGLFVERLTLWKHEYERMEFSDLIDQFNDHDLRIDADVAFIDEAQDLTPVQWDMVGRAFRGAQRLYIAGDDDQAIYHWAGADVSRMLQVSGESIVLAHSYRLPAQMFTLAARIAARIRVRKEKKWTPNGQPGLITHCAQLTDCDFTNGETWRLIARTGLTLPVFTRQLEERGLLYRFNGAWSLPVDLLSALRTAEKLRGGAQCTMAEGRAMLAWAVRPAANAVWRGTVRAQDIGAALLDDVHLLFGKLSAPRRRYIARLKSLDKFEIDVSTIHQSKGTEAHNVVLSPDLSRATGDALSAPAHSDNENRVMYVAVTRAQRRLWLLPATAEYAYNFGT